MSLKRLMFLFISFILISCSADNDKSILLLTERDGQHGSFTDASIEWLSNKADEMHFNITEINSTDLINKEFLSNFNLIIQLDYPPYGWGKHAEDAFIDYIDNGKGSWIGFHHATLLGDFDGYDIWPWFYNFMGDIVFSNYIADLADGSVNVELKNHEIFNGVDSTFVIPKDEWYTYNISPRTSSNIEVLATVDESSYNPISNIVMGDHPVIWSNKSKQSKNLYIQFGHSNLLYEQENFTKLFENAIRWAID